jgi:2-desacetyl-2-hydroxyethyl bacteriochlorophyllide A dehydrogenase
MNRRALVFTAPGRVEIVDERLPAPGPGQLLVRTAVAAISAGTELLAFRGLLPPELAVDETLAALGGSDRDRDRASGSATFRFPFRFGYAAVGEVLAAGDGVDPEWLGRDVFAFQPHASVFAVPVTDAVAVPAGLPAERAVLLAAMETAVNLILDGRPLYGERVVVLGQGTVGLLATALLAGFPLERLVAVEGHPLRAAAARRLGAHEVLAPGAKMPGDADLVYELSGDPAALDAAIAIAGREARVIVGSWYGAKRAPVDLGGHFHRGRLTITSSQVSHIAPGLSARWDRTRRWAAALHALGRIDTSALVTHRIPFGEAQQAYELLDRHAERAVQVLLVPG